MLFPQSEFDDKELEGCRSSLEGIQRLAAMRDLLAAFKMELLIVVVPNKIRIYPEFFYPSRILPNYLQSQYQNYLQKLRTYQISALDLETLFIKEKTHDRPFDLLYYTGDYHWTDRGCLTAAHAISNFIRRAHPEWCDKVTQAAELKPPYRIPGHDPTYKRLGFRNDELREYFVKDSFRYEIQRLHEWSANDYVKSPLILMGDSFSAHLKLLSSYLEMDLCAPVQDFARVALLPENFFDEWLYNQSFQDYSSRLIIWVGWESNVLGNKMNAMEDLIKSKIFKPLPIKL